MSFWSAVVLLFLIGSITWLRAQKYRAKGDRIEPAFLSGDAELEREVQELRKRVAVLERIATDEKKEADLARQIEALRD
ncbi:hypothetical protein [Novosphingobium album (ex Liu et al. 2023)]|uniref:Uncharacterized protein n=1 Tax=Novosphingobium album (ex Liu et al. 2023) TaxID=3031130 RepID=A0ABT5WSR4_9SPHN|nr:hypothetical protein [Novosphingobium album (ex Liu et al. 2023)]MDE8653079.1 hypothetical protein [Novosphingobium album (ex Liu et al. 2023)]